MTRREAREQAFCILFEQAVRGEDVEEMLKKVEEDYILTTGCIRQLAGEG